LPLSPGLADMDESHEAVVLISPVGAILFVNKALCLMFGYKKADMEGKNVSMLMVSGGGSKSLSFLGSYFII
jgi:PAS domain S-box-containing protein